MHEHDSVNVSEITKTYIHMSGGKDSTALLIHALREQPPGIFPVFADTGHEHPATYDYLSYLEEKLSIPILRVKADFTDMMSRKRALIQKKWPALGISQARIDRALEILVPTGIPFLDLCVAKGAFPRRLNRFCTSELKIRPFEDNVLLPDLKAGITPQSWVGVRADESTARSKMEKQEIVDPGYLMVRPILEWTVEDVFRVHSEAGVEPNPLYKLGMRRVGCMPCIMVGKPELAEIAARWPNEIQRVKEWEDIVGEVSKAGDNFFFHPSSSHGGKIEAAAEWSMTKHGGRELSLEKYIVKNNPTSCSSAYGLCE